MVVSILVLLIYFSVYGLGLASWTSLTVPPFFTKVNKDLQQQYQPRESQLKQQQQQHNEVNDETRSDADDYEPLPNDRFPTGSGLHEDGTLPTTLLNSAPWRANASDLVSVELLCILDDPFCFKVLTALKDAAQQFTHVVHLKTQLVIRAAYYEFCDHICANDTYGLGAPSSQVTLPFKDGDMNFIYPQALAKQLSPYEYTTSWVSYDVMIELNHDPYMNAVNLETVRHGSKWNGTGIPPFGKYWFKDDPDIQSYQIDFEYILLHEILHGVGFVSSWAAYFANNASPFHTLLDDIFDPADLEFVTPSPYWSVRPPTGPTFVTGFQPTMIFDKFLFVANTNNTVNPINITTVTRKTAPTMTTTADHASLMDLGFTMQDFCVQGHEAFIIHFVRSFQKSAQSHEARRLYSMLTQDHALTFQFDPIMAINNNNNNHTNATYNIIDYLNDTYTHMDLLTGEQTLNALNHHEQSGRLFRPGVAIAHVGGESQGTPDFIMTASYRQGITLQQWVDEVYANVPVIHYKVALNESTVVERTYKSAIGPGILRILDAMGYVTILDSHTNASYPLYNQNFNRQADDDGNNGDEDDGNEDDHLYGKQQQPYNNMMKKSKNRHRCDDMHMTSISIKPKTPTPNTSNKVQQSHSITMTIPFCF